MCYQWKVTLPSTEGIISIILDEDKYLQTQLQQYGEANYNTASSLLLGWVSLLSDNPHGPMPPAIYRLFTRRLARDMYGQIKSYSELADALMKSERLSGEGCLVRTFLPGFKKTAAFRVYLDWFKSGDPVLFRWLLSFLSFGKTAEFERPELELKAFTAWAENEVRLNSVKLTDVGLNNLQRVIAWLLDGLTIDTESLCPRHGPGKVAEKDVESIDEKNSFMSISEGTKKYFHFYGSSRDVERVGPSSLYPDYRGYYDFNEIPGVLTFVKKNYKTYRTISKVCIDKMYIGQAVRRQMYKGMKNARISRFVDLTDQTLNQVAARKGSETGRIDTIDLSNASNSVTWDLVRRAFPYGLLYHLSGLRTRQVVYGETLFTPKMYAPMGDPLCFPVQCIVFSAIVIASGISQSLGQDVCIDPLPRGDVEDLFNQTYAQSLKDPRGRYVFPRVFGDDICLDNRQTTSATRALRSFGFLVNDDKSFVGGETFRESCGKYYTRGHDVSFIRYRKGFPKSGTIDVRLLAGLIDQANIAYDFGYRSLRRYYVQLVLRGDVDGVAKTKCGRNPILFSNSGLEGMAIRFDESQRDENKHLVRAYNPYLQRWEYQSLGLKPIGRVLRDEDFTQYEYIQWQARAWYEIPIERRDWELHKAPDQPRNPIFVHVPKKQHAGLIRFDEPQDYGVPERADCRDVAATLRWTARW